jgi:hypothetical protein
LASAFAHPLSLAWKVCDRRQNQRGKKVYSSPAPEVECIRQGKAQQPYESGVKICVARTL